MNVCNVCAGRDGIKRVIMLVFAWVTQCHTYTHMYISIICSNNCFYTPTLLWSNSMKGHTTISKNGWCHKNTRTTTMWLLLLLYAVVRMQRRRKIAIIRYDLHIARRDRSVSAAVGWSVGRSVGRLDGSRHKIAGNKLPTIFVLIRFFFFFKS